MVTRGYYLVINLVVTAFLSKICFAVSSFQNQRVLLYCFSDLNYLKLIFS